MEFPQYRKYKNDLSYFKVLDSSHFTEYKTLGSKVVKYNFEAKILPDRNFIHDMLYDFEQHWVPINEAEFELFISQFDL